jgi:hypothetical protein
MNQLFNTVNYFEFLAFEALLRWKCPGAYIAQAGITRHFPSYFSDRARK